VLIFLRLNTFNADNVSLMFHGSSQDSVDGLAEFCERRLPRVRLRELTTQRINCIGDIELYLNGGTWTESVESFRTSRAYAPMISGLCWQAHFLEKFRVPRVVA
jgi:hypothetical protein